MTSKPVGEVVGVLSNGRSLQAAVDNLLISGFDRLDIRVVAGRRSVERMFGAMYDDGTDPMGGPEAPRTAHVECESRTQPKAALASGLACAGVIGAIGKVVSSGGTLSPTIEAAAYGGVS